MTRNIWIGVVVVILLIAGGWWYANQSSIPGTSELTESPTVQQNTNVQTPTATKPTQTPSQTSATSGWKKFESKDLGVSFMYPPEWGDITSSQSVTDAIGSLYGADYLKTSPGPATNLEVAWAASRTHCEGADKEKYGFDECWYRSFGVEIGGERKGIVSVTGTFYVRGPSGGNSFSLIATDLLATPCSADNKCSTFTNPQGITIQRRHGKWNMGG